jgi:hypothetical protein
MVKRSIWCAWMLLLAFGCAGEDLSVGELRCTGPGLRCELGTPVWPVVRDSAAPDGAAPGRATVVWQRALPCPYASCRGEAVLGYSGTRLVMHPDGTMTVAREIGPSSGLAGLGESDPLDAGVWLAGFDRDGELLWENDSLIAPREKGMSPPRAALALDFQGRAVLALQSRGLRSELTLYRVGDHGDLEQLFTMPSDAALEAVAIVDGGVLIASYHHTEGYRSPNPELARYTDNGELVWRQTGLRYSDFPGVADVGLTLAPALTLVADARGEALMLVPERDAVGLVQLRRDGNIVRYLLPAAIAFMDTPMRRAALAVDSRERVIVGQNAEPLLGDNAYALARIVPDSTADSGFSLSFASREREEYYDPQVLGLDHDADDRVLVVTPAGTREAPRVLIDRISEDFRSIGTLIIEGAQDLSAEDDFSAMENLLEIEGIRVGPDGDVYYWASSEIGRIALP